MDYGTGIKIYDIEVFPNAFLYKDIDKENDIINTFVIHEDINQLFELVEYLCTLKVQIGFNNRAFDSQICQFIINNANNWSYLSTDEITNNIFDYCQELINKQDVVKILDFPEKSLYCIQVDLFKIYHFDNIARIQSLKGLQCNLNWVNVLESEIPFNRSITKEELKIVEKYCENDILSTKFFYEYDKSREKIKIRKDLIKTYNLDMTAINWSDSKMGSELVLKLYCDINKLNSKNVRNLRTKRPIIHAKDCIVNNVSFSTKEFNFLLNKFSETTLFEENGYKFINDKGKKEEICIFFRGLDIYYGIGGVHASLTGVFESDDDYIIKDIDVSSLYPSIAIANGFFPEHLGPGFIKLYKENIVDVRLEEKKKKEKGNKAIVEALKLAANSIYGKSNDKHSFLYDPLYTLSTTITGQLQLSMLVENIALGLTFSEIIQVNTDGITVKIKRSEESVFKDICKKWEKLTKLELEEVEYRKMYIRDVNNYCAISTNGKIKLKGCFEKDKELHKDPSARIVSIALEEYIVNGKSVEDTINNHSVIWDFLLREKFKSNMRGKLPIGFDSDGNIIYEETQKVVRYFISNRGHRFYKIINDGRKSALEKDFNITVLNYVENENAFDYDINKRYYIKEAYKIIDAVEKNRVQLSLF